MTPRIGLPVVVYGGFENSLTEHAAVITFVHHQAISTLEGQMGTVNVRVFLDGLLQDRMLRMVPFMASRERAVELNLRGAGYMVFAVEPDTGPIVPQQGDPSPPFVPEFSLYSPATLGVLEGEMN